MRTIQQLHDAAKKEREKSDGFRKEAQKHRDKALSFPTDADPNLGINENNAAQKLEEKAAEHDNTAMEFERQAADLEQKALELERKKQDLIANKQAEIDRIDEEERIIRGDTRALF